MPVSNVLRKNNVCVEGALNAEECIIFAHGFGTDQTSWREVKSYFSKSYKIVLYDNVGAGDSDVNAYSPVKYQSLQGYADDLIQILSVLNIRKAIFVGHSVSSMVGLCASVKIPDLFSRMVLIGASARYLNDEGYFGGFNQGDLNELYSGLTSNYYEWASGFSKLAIRNEDRPFLSREFTQSLLSLRPDVALSVARSIFQSDMRHILKNVVSEVLLLQANEDIAVPLQAAEYLHKNITGSQLKRINAEGHFPQISAPREVAYLIFDFINKRFDAKDRLVKTNG